MDTVASLGTIALISVLETAVNDLAATPPMFTPVAPLRLVPVITIKKANKHNTSGFTFRWLFFTFWSLDAFQFQLSFNIDTHWGIGITFLLPYLVTQIHTSLSNNIQEHFIDHLNKYVNIIFDVKKQRDEITKANKDKELRKQLHKFAV